MKKIEGADRIKQELPDILHDESRFECGVPSRVCFPESAGDLQIALAEAVAAGLPVTFIGAQTGTTGGAVPEEGVCAISFSSMNRIHSVRWDDENRPVLNCDPGVTLDAIERFLKEPSTWLYKVPGSEKIIPGAYLYPPDPTEMTAQLGGTVATNASGARSYRFGPTRSHVAWLDLILATGETVTVRRSHNGTPWDRQLTTDQGTIITVPPLPYVSPEIKNAAGYFSSKTMDAIDLFIGSEGTLAAISGIGISLQSTPKILSGLTFFNNTGSTFDFADFLRKEAGVAAIEFFDNGSLRFIDRYRSRLPDKFPEFPKDAATALLWEYIEEQPGNFEIIMARWEATLVNCGSSFDATWSGFDDAEKERLHHFRHALPEMVNSIIAENKRSCREIRKIGTDSAFPAEVFRASYGEMMRMIEESGLTFAAFGHLGDHHIHINLIPSTADELATALKVYDELMTLAVKNNGTVSAEHGIGKIKKKYLPAMYGVEAVSAMRDVKAALDPRGMLNPGNLF